MWYCVHCGCNNIAASLRNCPVCGEEPVNMSRWRMVHERGGGERRVVAPKKVSDLTPAQWRAWAEENGYPVPKGKIPQSLVDAYNHAQAAEEALRHPPREVR